MGGLAPGCSESRPGATPGTAVAVEPWAALSPSPGCPFGSSWVTCAPSLLGVESGFLTPVQYLTLSFLLLPILESLKNFSHSTPPEAAGHRAKPRVSNMEVQNQTWVTQFILVGFPGSWGARAAMFLMFLVAYILTVAENTIIILLVQQNRPLHKPMYFFLANLSFLETWYISVTVPKLLFSFWSVRSSISFTHCMIQLYFFIALMCTECVLLAAMAYDRYVAICRPLHYHTAMSHGLCFRLALASWAIGFGISLAKIYFISRLDFCGPNVINHFFCDISPVLNLSCTDMSLAELVDFILALVIFLFPLSVTVLSYGCILATVLRMPTGKQKAFSTCASHLVVVTVFYSATIFMYARPRAIHAFNMNKVISIFYAIVTPALNPFIYCLRNREVKEALKKLVYCPAICSESSLTNE
ncbi:olfactory receptor 6B1 isoform X2 [Phyllostomus discolor]|uniref:Olfactory receptor 6B1 isoform X2 n=1 Tax=Phyllostomus discolor TaxID=89673 RepID=A0A6J2MLK7_9CHIR|nr:olfactory receptor 6B1 isoform X2 [Phyllostomus discolor]